MRAGNVIKQTNSSGDADQPKSSVVKRAVVDAKEDARRIIAAAESDAAALLEGAEREAQELRERARREGFEASLLELNEHLLDARERRDSALAEAEADVLRLAVKIAEKIIGRQIENDDAALAGIVATALRNARQQEMLVVRVNPADLPLVQARRERLDQVGRARFLDLVPDPRVAHGGCIIESESGTVDAQLETQLRVLERALLARTTGDRR